MLLISHKKTTKKKRNERSAARNLSPTNLSPTKKRNITHLRDYTIRRYLSLSESSIWSSRRQTTLPRLWWICWVPATVEGGSGDRDSYNMYVAPGLSFVLYIFFLFFPSFVTFNWVRIINRRTCSQYFPLSFRLSVSLCCVALLTHCGALWNAIRVCACVLFDNELNPIHRPWI